MSSTTEERFETRQAFIERIIARQVASGMPESMVSRLVMLPMMAGDGNKRLERMVCETRQDARMFRYHFHPSD